MSSILRALRTLPIYVVTGKTKYNSFDADAAVPAMDTGTLNDLLNASGALGVTQITDITGLTAWKDYIPVQNEAGRTVPFSYDANGYFPIKKVSGSIFSVPNSALLHFNGTNGTQVFTDELGATWAAGGGSTVLTTGNKKFGTASLACGGRGVYSDNTPMTFNANDFIVDFWLSSVAESNVPWLFHMKPNGATALGLGINYSAGVLTVYLSTDGSTWHTGGAVITSTSRVITASSATFNHIELSRVSGSLRLFVDGTQRGSTYNIGTTSIITGTRFLIGNLWDPTATTYGVNGQIDEFRVKIGEGGHTANFTPPVAEYA